MTDHHMFWTVRIPVTIRVTIINDNMDDQLGELMKRTVSVLAFISGCVILTAAFGIGWASWGNLPTQEVSGIMRTLMVAILVVVACLAVIAITSSGSIRWLSLLLDALMIIGFGILLFDIGLFFLPFALGLLILSVAKLKRNTLVT